MSICNLNWYDKKVRRIMRDVKALKQKDIASVENISQQSVSMGLRDGKYEKSLIRWIQILDIAGYEIREKEEA